MPICMPWSKTLCLQSQHSGSQGRSQAWNQPGLNSQTLSMSQKHSKQTKKPHHIGILYKWSRDESKCDSYNYFIVILKGLLFYNKYRDIGPGKTNTTENQNLLNRLTLNSWPSLMRQPSAVPSAGCMTTAWNNQKHMLRLHESYSA